MHSSASVPAEQSQPGADMLESPPWRGYSAADLALAASLGASLGSVSLQQLRGQQQVQRVSHV